MACNPMNNLMFHYWKKRDYFFDKLQCALKLFHSHVRFQTNPFVPSFFPIRLAATANSKIKIADCQNPRFRDFVGWP